MNKHIVVISCFLSAQAWALNAPSNLVATKVISSEVALKWSDRSKNESGFIIYRSPNTVDFGQIGWVGRNVVSFRDLSVKAGTKYYYRVRSFRDATPMIYSPVSQSLIVNTPGSAPEPVGCALPWGGTLASGSSVVAFKDLSVASGSSCVSEQRVCTNGALSGSYQHQSCSVQSAPPPPSDSFTHFVRPDGGNSSQCNGKANAAYPGSGTNLNCAWKSITYALGMETAVKLVSGDKLYIETGTYRIGYGAPGAELNTNNCYSSYTPECAMSAVPSGVTISGNCTNRPKLVGVKGTYAILNLTNASNVTLKCLEVTDEASCIVKHNTANGQQKKPCLTSPHEDYAQVGIYAKDSSNVVIDRVNIHGLAHDGVQAGRIADWLIQDSNIDANGWVGWHGNINETSSSNSGVIKFLRTSISFNGCIEKVGGGYEGCWGQVSGGYGDGLGTEATAGTWVFDQVKVVGNTSDGIDLLYVKNPGGNVTVKNSYAGYNAGNQIKTNQSTVIENNVVVGNCSFHTRFGATMVKGELCRASGNALSIGLSVGETGLVKNNTITGEGDCLVLGTSSSNGGGTINITGNIMDARKDWSSSYGESSCFYYYYGTGSLTNNVSSNLVYNAKEGCIPGQICQNPMFLDPAFSTFNPALQSGSPAVGYVPNLSLIPNGRP